MCTRLDGYNDWSRDSLAPPLALAHAQTVVMIGSYRVVRDLLVPPLADTPYVHWSIQISRNLLLAAAGVTRASFPPIAPENSRTAATIGRRQATQNVAPPLKCARVCIGGDDWPVLSHETH